MMPQTRTRNDDISSASEPQLSRRHWLHPPAPALMQATFSNSGQRLLNQWKRLESATKPADPSNDKDASNTETSGSKQSALCEILDHLQNLATRVQRRGLLQGDASLAQRVLVAAASNTNDAAPNSSHQLKKRKNRGEGKRSNSNPRNKLINNELTMVLDGKTHLISDGAGALISTTLDVQLLMTALSRILESSKKQQSTNESIVAVDVSLDDSLASVVAAAANLLTAAGEYVKSFPSISSSHDPCFLAEYELIAASGKSLLTGLAKHAMEKLEIIQKHDMSDDCDGIIAYSYMIGACLRAAVSLVSLFGTKLSRSTLVITSLRNVAWATLTLVDSFAVEAATLLLATLVWTGCSAVTNISVQQQQQQITTSPSALWTQSVVDVIGSIAQSIRLVAPIVQERKRKDVENVFSTGSCEVSDFVTETVQNQWLSKINQSSSECTRVHIFLQLLHRLVGYMVALLARESVGVTLATRSSQNMQLMGAHIDVDSICNLVETMLSFSAASEAKYYGTKKRLRLEAVDGGLLSPVALTGNVALAVRLHGHELLDFTVTALGTATLLPYARRFQKISHNALLTSSSSALRRVLDPSTASKLEGKWQRWLHTSVACRSAAVVSFQHSVAVFGTDPRVAMSSSSLSTRSSAAGSVDRAVALVCGHVIEELSSASTGDWGSLDERLQLVATCADCLTCTLTTGGEYLPIGSRELIDSVVSTLISASQNAHPMSLFSSFKSSVIHLGIATVCTPWIDGAASSLTGELLIIGRVFQNDRDSAVALVATTALRVCDALDCPRVPALNVVTRPTESRLSSSKLNNAEFLVGKLLSAREEILRIYSNDQSKNVDDQSNPAKKLMATLADEGHHERDVALPEAETLHPRGEEVDVAKDFHLLPHRQDGEAAVDEKSPIPTPSSSTGIPKVSSDTTVQVKDDEDEGFPSIVDCPPDQDDVSS